MRSDGLVYQAFQEADGLSHNEVRQIVETDDGYIWIATRGGLTRVRPSRVPPRIQLLNVVADREYGSVEELRIPSSQSLVSFDFLGRSFRTRPGHLAYVYRMDGYEEDWQVTRAWVERQRFSTRAHIR